MRVSSCTMPEPAADQPISHMLRVTVLKQGEVLAEKLVVPRLTVRKDWYKGLDPDPIDHSHPDVGIRPDAQDGSTGLLMA